MRPGCHRSRRRLLRLLAALLALAGLVAQPVFATLGEVHELLHLPAGSPPAAVHLDDTRVGSTADCPGADLGSALMLHALLHFAHCCGATVGAAWTVPPTRHVPAALPPAEPAPAAPASVRGAVPLKPPRRA